MYQSLEQVRANSRVTLSDTTKYPDDMVIDFIEEAGAIIDSYLGYSLLLDEGINEETLCIPTSLGEFLVTLHRRYINQVHELDIETEFGVSVLTISGSANMEGNIFLARNEGFLKTFGGCVQSLFSTMPDNHYKAIVTYSAGFPADELPDDFLKAFYAILRQIKTSHDTNNVNAQQNVSSKIKKYQTLNETVEFVEDKNKDGVGNLLADWVKSTLNRYKLSNQGIGIYM